jgi:hypothetical protein
VWSRLPGSWKRKTTSKHRLAAAALAALVLLAGCAAPEQALLDEFFGASRLRDLTALQAISTTIFEPLQQGIVRTFRVAGPAAERTSAGTVSKEVTVDATVATPDGRTVQKTLIVTMERRDRDGSRRWIVTAVREAPARPPS